jgi:hypoxanthine-DNA glycosylase
MDQGRLTGLAPVVGARTRLLILGSFPSVASLQEAQYYAHPSNHFWPLMTSLLARDFRAMDYARRIEELRARGVGIWDVYAACRRHGSLDSAIEAPEPNDLLGLARGLPQLRVIAHNGGESARAMKHTRALGLPVHRLPSSSAANASWSFERKRQAWEGAFREAGLLDAS